MVSGVPPIIAGPTKTAAVVRNNSSTAEILDKKVKALSEKMMKIMCRFKKDESDYNVLYSLLGKLTRAEAFRWMQDHNIKACPAVLSEMADENLAVIVLLMASLPEEVYSGVELYLYKKGDASAAHYDFATGKLGFNGIGGMGKFTDKEWLNYHFNTGSHLADVAFASIVAHELAHRWADRYYCGDFFRISWEEEGNSGVFPETRLGKDGIDPNDFASSYGASDYLEDLSTIVEEMMLPQTLVRQAFKNILERADTDLADKIFYCYKFYGGAKDSENWIVRTRPGAYVCRFEGVTQSFDFVKGVPLRKRISDQFDPNVIIKSAIRNSPMLLRSTL